MRFFLRLASLSASVALLVGNPGCSDRTCSAELDGFTLTMQRTFDVQVANVAFGAIDVCADSTCARASAAQGIGTQTFDWSTKGFGTLTSSTAPDGRLVVAAEMHVWEQTAPLTITITVHDGAGTPYAATAAVGFHDTQGGCHSAPDTTTL